LLVPCNAKLLHAPQVHRTAYGLAGCLAAVSAYIHSYNSLQLSAATVNSCEPAALKVQSLEVHAAALAGAAAVECAGTVHTALLSSRSSGVNDSSSSSKSESERRAKRQRCSDDSDTTAAATAAGTSITVCTPVIGTAAAVTDAVQLLHFDSSCDNITTTGATAGAAATTNSTNSSTNGSGSSAVSSSSSSSTDAQAAALLKTALYELDMVTLMGCPATRATANQVSLVTKNTQTH
jgi:hypothetical protein